MVSSADLRTYQDEDPAPAIRPDDSSHERNALVVPVSYSVFGARADVVDGTDICEDATKGACEGCGAEEERDTKLALSPLVPHGEVVHYAREETRLGYSSVSLRPRQVEVLHSPIPKKNLATKKPVRFCTIPISVETMPQATVRLGSHSLGEVFFKMILHGTFGPVSPNPGLVLPFHRATNLE